VKVSWHDLIHSNRSFKQINRGKHFSVLISTNKSDKCNYSVYITVTQRIQLFSVFPRMLPWQVINSEWSVFYSLTNFLKHHNGDIKLKIQIGPYYPFFNGIVGDAITFERSGLPVSQGRNRLVLLKSKGQPSLTTSLCRNTLMRVRCSRHVNEPKKVNPINHNCPLTATLADFLSNFDVIKHFTQYSCEEIGYSI
jgi:hypothetical protein